MRKNDSYYFSNFVQCAECSVHAATTLNEALKNFDVDTLSVKMQQLHEIEHAGDGLKHDMMRALVRAFITPIEREDILSLSQNIDDVTDYIEDIIIHIYTNNVTSIREDVSAFCELLIKSCSKMKQLLIDFSQYPKSKNLEELIIEINALEENGDRMYIKAMKQLHTTVDNPLDVIAWREIYSYFERCFDACEHVADVIEGIALKNK